MQDRQPVKEPGSRGGHWYRNRQGEVRYGVMPVIRRRPVEKQSGVSLTKLPHEIETFAWPGKIRSYGEVKKRVAKYYEEAGLEILSAEAFRPFKYRRTDVLFVRGRPEAMMSWRKSTYWDTFGAHPKEDDPH